MKREPFGHTPRRLIGMIHLDALPGSPDYKGKMESILRRALSDSEVLVRAGFDGLMVENYNDTPFLKDSLPAETVAALTRCALAIKSTFPTTPLGVNALRNDGLSSLAIAHAVEADFIRVNVLCGAVVTDQGLIEGCAAKLIRLKTQLKSTVQVWADLDVKHAKPLVDYDDQQFLSDLIVRGRADCVILSGTGTGQPTCAKRVNELQASSPVPVAVGSGISESNIHKYNANRLIVGTSLKHEGQICPKKAKHLVERRNRLEN